MEHIKKLNGISIQNVYELKPTDPGFYRNIDVGIRPLVRAINHLEGISTTMPSCSGHRGPIENIWKGYQMMGKRFSFLNRDLDYQYDFLGIHELGITLAGYKTDEEEGIKNHPKCGVTIVGNLEKVQDYVNFLIYCLHNTTYGRDVLEFQYSGIINGDAEYFIHTDPWRIKDNKMGFLEMMAQWALLTHFTEKYQDGYSNGKKEVPTIIIDPRTEKGTDRKQNWRVIDNLIKTFEEHNIFDTNGRTDFTVEHLL